ATRGPVKMLMSPGTRSTLKTCASGRLALSSVSAFRYFSDSHDRWPAHGKEDDDRRHSQKRFKTKFHQGCGRLRSGGVVGGLFVALVGASRPAAFGTWKCLAADHAECQRPGP